MKIRSGFVSNSSSSSFVVALPKKPENAKELQEMIFGVEENSFHERICQKFLDDIIKESTKEDIINVMKRYFSPIDDPLCNNVMEKSGVFGWDFYDFIRNMSEEDKVKLRAEKTKLTEEYVDNLLKEKSGQYFCILRSGKYAFRDEADIRGLVNKIIDKFTTEIQICDIGGLWY